ncbi:MAG: Fe-S metabolism protein SufE [Verrucomicrobia bacterium]|nr:Fe-S metabolism protein SufE [Verrucomicrobiota bacterium]
MTNSIPHRLQQIIDFYEQLPDDEKREALINEAALSEEYAPAEGEVFDVESIRKDTECSDTVGIFVNASEDSIIQFKISLGEKVQTLTRALSVILCKGLKDCSADEITNLPESFVPRIVGSELYRLRSRTIYYMLRRLKEAVEKLTNQ